MFSVEWWLQKVGCWFRDISGLQFLLAACGSLISFFSVKFLEGFFQKYPRYFEGIPLCYKEFMFKVSCYAARNVAESKVVGLSKSEGVEYT